MNKKSLGSYYTPFRLAKFMTDYCLSQLDSDQISILEPSVGDGVFIKAINESTYIKNFNSIDLEIVERERDEMEKAIQKNISLGINIISHKADYLSFQKINQNQYSLIIGNPPYIKSNLLTEEQKEQARKIHMDQQLSKKKINNIWTAFVVSAISKLKHKGILAFVLPLELLQVKFTSEIRDLLKISFCRLEIFMFDELQFQECKGQDIVLLIGHKEHKAPGIFYTTINKMDDLESNRFCLQQNVTLSGSDKKWTHHFISSEEYIFLEKLNAKLRNVSSYVENKAGIVTAANDFFIVNDEVLEQFKLKKFSKPIVQKGFFVNGSVTFNNQDFVDLVTQNKPAYLLDFNLANPNNLPNGVQQYITIGEEQKLHLRYKCKKRKYWYQVPNVVEKGEAFFFKRAHDYPKLLKNEASIHVTDSAYVIKSKEGVSINDFVYSFYNSLTLAFAELEGRYYGGGVLELTPNEFRILPIPYVTSGDFEDYKAKFKAKANIEEILNENNYCILNTALGVSLEDIKKVECIRKKLIHKRHKK